MWPRLVCRHLIRKDGVKALPIIRCSTTGSDSTAGSGHGVQDFTVTDPVMAVTPRFTTGFSSKDFTRHFKEILPDLIRDLTYESHFKDVPKVNEHVAKCLQYNLMHGKQTRGLAVPVTYRLLVEGETTEDMMTKAYILGWCIELMQSFFLVADDVMDGSSTRRGQDCWYKKDNVGLMAINDALIIESCIYAILNKHFKDTGYYDVTVDAFLKAIRFTTIGQSLDMLSQVKSKDETGPRGSLDDFNMKLYNNIVKHKTAYYSFFFPVQVGMGLAGIQDPELHRQAKHILLETGKFFQIQDDYLDCFGDPEVTGKIGTDIADGKCSWLIVMAMQRATPKQKEILKECYGLNDSESVSRVKEIYEELKLPKVYHSFEEDTYNDILSLIGQMSGGKLNKRLNPEVFYYFLNRIYKRDK